MKDGSESEFINKTSVCFCLFICVIFIDHVIRMAMGPNSFPWDSEVLEGQEMPGVGKHEFATAASQKDRL